MVNVLMDADYVRELRQWAEKKAGFEGYAQLAAEWEAQREAIRQAEALLNDSLDMEASGVLRRALAVSSSAPTTKETE
jgi:hypothetical protein